VVPRAIDYAQRAGRRASFALAYEEAARHFRMGLALVELLDGPMDERRIDLLLSLGDVQARAGDLSSRETFLQALELARQSGTPQQLARAAIGIGGRLPWLRAGNDTQLIPALQDALVLLGGADDRLRVRLLGRLACAWRSAPEQRDQSGALSRQAVDLARELGDPATLSYALASRYWATWWPENTQDRLPLAEEMVEVAEASGDAERKIDALLMHFIAFTEIGRMTDARRRLQDVSRLAQEVSGLTPWQLWLGLAPVSEVALMDGNYPQAAELLAREAEYGFPGTSTRDDVSAWRMQAFLLAREQGTLAEVEQDVRASAQEFPWYPCHRAALVLLLIGIGREGDARAAFVELAQDGFRALYRDNEWLLGMALVSEACALLEETDHAAILYEQLLPFAGSHAIGHAEGSVGATDRYLGLLAAMLGRLDAAIEHLEAGVQMNEQMGLAPWAAHTQVDLARTLRARGSPGDARRAAELQDAALVTARVLGMTALEAAITSSGTEDVRPSSQARIASSFRREGDYWTIVYDGHTVRVRDSKGMHHLARLLGEPGREFHALDLAADRLNGANTVATGDTGLSVRDAGDAGIRLDAEAKAAYLGRMQELRDEVAEAEGWNDGERAARARQEIDFLTQELKGAVGLGGRDRREASAAERARLSVTRATRSAIGRIKEQHAALGRHFEATIRTGTFCSYQPDPRVPTVWEL
jgi:tetratricopeptide (TPR) repeat protein